MRYFLMCIFAFIFGNHAFSQVLINEIYGGGGNSGATWTHDVVQLKNFGSSSVNLTGYAIQYAKEYGVSWEVDAIPAGTIIGANQILNIKLASDGLIGGVPPSPSVQALPLSDGLINLSASAGKVALTSNTISLTGSNCPTGAVDYVGYGNSGSQTCGPHTTETIAQSINYQSYRRTNTVIPGVYVVDFSPLPVRFREYNVINNDRVSAITFSTASETNNDYFTIERSGDGRSYDAIGEIDGAGDSRSEIKYAFTDEQPLPGINYYRIKQTDFDGRYDFSEVRAVRHSRGNLVVTPRTTEGRLQVVTDASDYSLEVYNTSGHAVKTFMSLSQDQSISIEDLTAGIYYIRTISGGHAETIRIVKM